MEVVAFHSCFRLVQSRSLFQIVLFSLGKDSSNFFNSLFFPRSLLQILRILITLQMLCPLFPFWFTSSSSSFFRICASPLHTVVDFVILCKCPVLPFVLLIICVTFFDASTPSFSSHLPFSHSVTTTTFARRLPILDGSKLSHSLSPTTQYPTSIRMKTSSYSDIKNESY